MLAARGLFVQIGLFIVVYPDTSDIRTGCSQMAECVGVFSWFSYVRKRKLHDQT